MVKAFTRLPKNVKPIHYVLTVTPDLNSYKANGTVTIDLEISDYQSTTLRINCAEIVINCATLNSHASESVEFDLDNEEAHITFPAEAFSQNSKLHIDFQADINNKMKGFYRSKYTKNDGSIGYIATTHFEPTGARMAFPCFDEPSFRSTFQINLISPADLQTLSNMNIEATTNSQSGTKHVKFATTPSMPTYLVAFIFGEFDHVERFTKNNIPVRVYTPLKQGEYGVLAAEFGVKCVEWYEDFFGIKYPLPKLDMIGIMDYPLGGMENWGLITYAMRALMYNPETDSKDSWQIVLAIIAHEIAHMWFGNYVTIEWWSDLWLKEGFATFLQYYCCDQILPDAKIWDVFKLIRYTKALELDGLQSSHPIEVNVGHPRECSQVFDQISYSKGASLIRMLFHWMGEDKFKKATSHYLTKHAYESCKTVQLWEAFEESINSPEFPVRQVGKQWTAMKNYPVIKAELIGGTELKLSQTCVCESGQKWQVPLNVRINDQDWKILMSADTTTLTVPTNALININPDAGSFIRCNYSQELLDRMFQNFTAQSAHDKMSIMSDLFHQVNATTLSLTDFLTIIFKHYSDIELDYAIFAEMFKIFALLAEIIQKSGQTKQWAAKRMAFIKSHFAKIGYSAKEGESLDNEMLRPLFIGQLIGLGDEECINWGTQAYKTGNFTQKIGAVVYKAYLKSNEPNALNNLIALYDETPIEQSAKRSNLRTAMGSLVSCEKSCQAGIDCVFSEQFSQSERGWMLGALPTMAGGNFSSYFDKIFMPKFLDIHKELQETVYIFQQLVKATLSQIADKKQIDGFMDLIDKHQIKEAHMAVAQGKDCALVNCGIVDRESDRLAKFFSN